MFRTRQVHNYILIWEECVLPERKQAAVLVLIYFAFHSFWNPNSQSNYRSQSMEEFGTSIQREHCILTSILQHYFIRCSLWNFRPPTSFWCSLEFSGQLNPQLLHSFFPLFLLCSLVSLMFAPLICIWQYTGIFLLTAHNLIFWNIKQTEKHGHC